MTYFLPSAEILFLSLLSIRPWLWSLISWFKEAGSLPLASFLPPRTQLEFTTIVLGPQVWGKWGVILKESAVLSPAQAHTATCWPPAVTSKQMSLNWRMSKFPSPSFKPTPHGHSVVDETCLLPLVCSVRFNLFKHSIFRNSPCPPASLLEHSMIPKPSLYAK